MKSSSFHPPVPVLLLIALALFAHPGAKGATFTWTGASSNAWNNPSNWAGFSAPPPNGLAITDIVYNGATSTFPSLTGGYSVRSLNFNNANNGYVFSSGALTLGTGGLTQNSASSQLFDIPVSLGAASNWTIGTNGAGTLTFQQGLALGTYALQINALGSNTLAGNISGTGELGKNGPGTLTLTGANTSTGTVTVDGGSLAIPSGSLGGGSVIVSAGAQLLVSGSANVPSAAGNYVTVDGTAASPATLTVTGGSINLNGGYIGNVGTGILQQSGGTISSTDTTFPAALGQTTTGNGVYHLSGGTLTTDNFFYVGYNGTGVVQQSGGTLSADQLLLGRSSGSSGTYHLNGGTLHLSVVASTNGTSTLNFNGGVLKAKIDTAIFLANTSAANVRAGGAVIDTNGRTVTISQPLLHSTQGGDPAIDGGLVKTGSGTLRLTGANTFTGGVTIKAGTLQIANASFLGQGGPVQILPGGALQFTDSAVSLGARAYQLSGSSQLVPASGGVLSYTGTTVNGGILGTGTHVLGSNASLIGTRTAAGAALSLSGSATFTNVTLGGNTTLAQANGTTLLAAGEFIATPLTTLTLGGTILTSGAYLSGLVTIQGGGRLNKDGSATPLYLDGSRGVTVASSGELNAASGSSIELGGLLTNHGTQTGLLNVNLGGLVQGSGTFGTVQVKTAGTFSSAGMIAGALTVDSGGLVALSGSGRALTVQGAFVNHGFLRFDRGAALSVTGGAQNFVNTGTIDVISGSASLPAGLINQGLILDRSVVRVKAIARSPGGGSVSLQIDGYPGHTYQLQRASSLTGGDFANVPDVPAQSVPAGNTAAMTLTFQDASPLAEHGFYRVQVD